jgi:hypothetical protein
MNFGFSIADFGLGEKSNAQHIVEKNEQPRSRLRGIGSE